MYTYKDHPLAFLCARSSPNTLRYRAENWRKKKFEADGMDVAGLLDRTADHIVAFRSSLHEIMGMIEHETPLHKVKSALAAIEIDGELANEAMDTAQTMRVRMLDPYGGSVSATLEVACDEIRLVQNAVSSALEVSETTGLVSSIAPFIREALDMEEVPEATHEAPRYMM